MSKSVQTLNEKFCKGDIHDIRNIISPITGVISILETKKLPHDQLRLINTIRKCIAELVEKLDELRAGCES